MLKVYSLLEFMIQNFTIMICNDMNLYMIKDS